MRWFQADAESMLNSLKAAFDAPARQPLLSPDAPLKQTYSGQRKSCEVCLSSKTRVLETRASADKTRRRHRCMDCGHKFSTYEAVGRITAKPSKLVGAAEDVRVAGPGATPPKGKEMAPVGVGHSPAGKTLLVAPIRGRRSTLTGRPIPRGIFGSGAMPSRDAEPLGPSSAFDAGRVLAAQALAR